MALILASASPRRRELMNLITEDHEVRNADVDEREIEKRCEGRSPAEIAMELARAKAAAVSAGEGDIIIGADTSVVLDGRILGKPEDKEDARRMLTELSGRIHSVITGVCVIRDGAEKTFYEETFVEFNPLDDFQKDLIERYISSDEPYDKAGAYGIQGGGALLVKKIEGDYFNVVGLPVAGLAREILI
ncbi:MAG: septum formation protein Maf [Clostridiales bacterium]|nr:septum formation protein Maf [Clostridiales bacterium]MBR6483771.1 septum formation protein Maf [Clostridiales bacterium]